MTSKLDMDQLTERYKYPYAGPSKKWKQYRNAAIFGALIIAYMLHVDHRFKAIEKDIAIMKIEIKQLYNDINFQE